MTKKITAVYQCQRCEETFIVEHKKKHAQRADYPALIIHNCNADEQGYANLCQYLEDEQPHERE